MKTLKSFLAIIFFFSGIAFMSNVFALEIAPNGNGVSQAYPKLALMGCKTSKDCLGGTCVRNMCVKKTIPIRHK